MHKLYVLFFAALLTVCLSGCAEGPDKAQIQPPELLRSAKSGESQSPESSPSIDIPSSFEQTEASESNSAEQQSVDIDLTGFSANMLYAEICNMGMSPDDYKGKIIKMTGTFACFPKAVDDRGNPISDEKIFVCLISDAMACCQTGVEFIPEKDSPFWKEYPVDGSKITITGLCDISLDESGWVAIIQLNDAMIEWVN